MELLKKNIRMFAETEKVTDQITVEEDCIVPDSLPDAGKIVWKKAFIRMEDIQADEGRITLNGQLKVQILYLDDTSEHGLHQIEDTVPFQKMQMLGEQATKENTQIIWKLEDITVSMINSRKMGIHGLISFQFTVEESRDVQAVVEMHGVSDVSIRRKKMDLLELRHQKKDVFRIKENLTLPSSKPTISQILWDTMQLRGIEIRPSEGKLEIKGEMFLFLLYEGENAGIQWMESAVPFQGTLEYPQAQSDILCRAEVQMEHYKITPENDYDGEQRQILTEATLNLDIHLYEEERADILEDVYSPVKELLPVREEQFFESLLVKRNFRIKTKGRLKLGASQPRILQICSSVGEGSMDDIQVTEKGLVIEGAVLISTLYVSSDDRVPYAVLEDAIPFQQTVEVPGLNENSRYQVQNYVEQLSVNMLDSETLEASVTLSVDLFVVELHREACMTEVEMQEMDLKKLQDLPGIVGYIVQPEDTLWSIAKQYYTTPEKICALNQIEEKDVRPGMGLVIVKTVLSN